MKKSRKGGQYSLVLISFFLIAFGVSVTGTTLKVCEIGCEFSSIGEAVDNSSSGDRIKVQNGDYSENLSINRNLTIVGANARWVRITPDNPDSPSIVIGPSSSAEVKISQVTIGGNEANRPDSGVIVTGEGRLTLTDSRVKTFRNGLAARDYSRLKIRNTEITSTEMGISGSDNSEVILSNSKVSTAGTGLLAENSAEVTIVDTEVTGCNSNALIAKETGRLNILSSTITNNQAPGLVLRNFSRLSMEDSQVSSNEGGGILLTNSAIANLNGNQITYNEKKNVSVISKKCGFSGPSSLFFGEVNRSGNEIKPANSDTICPPKLARSTASGGSSYSYPFKPSTYAFIGLVGIASLYFLIS